MPLPPAAGFTVVQVLTTGAGDRESVHTVDQVSPTALSWSWRLVELTASGDTVRQAFEYEEQRADIASAIRLRLLHGTSDPRQHPGYTMHSISTAVYRRLRAAGADSFQVMSIENPDQPAFLGMGGTPVPVRWRGRLATTTVAPVPLAVIVNGKRTELPALPLRGRFTAGGRTWEPELWVLADSTYPLLLKWIGAARERANVLQTTRIDTSAPTPESLERDLASACRTDLPGIYFGFNSAAIDSSSSRTFTAVATLLRRHASWVVTLEGHTDSIGTAAANKVLSDRRVAAVRDRLVTGYGIAPGRVQVVGFGSARPRESNATIEGRARNRRVELVRQCTDR